MKYSYFHGGDSQCMATDAEQDEPEYECANCGDIIDGEYKNANIRSEKDEHFCNEDCENEFHRKNA